MNRKTFFSIPKSEFWNYFKKNTVIILIPTVALSVFLFILCFHITKSDIKSSMSMTATEKSSQLREMLSATEHINYALYTDPYTKAVILNDNPLDTNPEFVYMLQKTQSNLKQYVNMYDYIDSIYLYCSEPGYVYSNQQNAYIDRFFSKNWYTLWEKNHFENMIVKNTCPTLSGTKKYLSTIYNIRYDKKTIGAIVINIDETYVDRILSVESSENTTYYICTDGDNILYSTEDISVSAPEYVTQNDKTRIKYSGISVVHSINETGLNLVMTMHENYLSKKMSFFFVIILTYDLFITIIVFLMSFRISKRYYNNISDILSILSTYDSEASTITNGKNELAYIKSKISSLYKDYTQSEIELSQKIIALKSSQVVALQMQINPHFILNSLNVINLMIMNDGDLHSDAAKAISLLAEVISNILRSEDYMISIEQEIYNTKKYIEFAKMKFGNSLDVIWDVDKSCLQYKTVKFIMQPIVENSIEHGFANSTIKDAMIKISIKEKKQNIEFTLSDNGSGISKNKRAMLEALLNDKNIFKDRNIAIANIHKRIQIIFGIEYGCKIVSSDSSGTVIGITIPIIKN